MARGAEGAVSADAIREVLRSMGPNEIRALVGQPTVEERRARYEREREARLARMTVVQFTRAYRSFNAGEKAGLSPKEANAAIAEGFCFRVSGQQPVSAPTRQSEQEREVERAQVEQVARFIATLDEDQQGHFDASGLPALAQLSRLAGFDVSAEIRDQAWARFQSQQDERGV